LAWGRGREGEIGQIKKSLEKALSVLVKMVLKTQPGEERSVQDPQLFKGKGDITPEGGEGKKGTELIG